MPIQVPAYNNAGLVDPAANAMQGLATMYSIADEEAGLRDKNVRSSMLENAYGNALKDNPLLAADRQNKLSQAALEDELFKSGLRKRQAVTAGESDIDVNQGKGSIGRQQQQAEAATGILQADAIVKEWLRNNPGEIPGKSLAFDDIWRKSVAPHLKKFNIDIGDRSTPEGYAMLQSLTPGAIRTQEYMQKMALAGAGHQSAENVARIQAQNNRYGPDTQYAIARDFPGADKAIGEALQRYMAGDRDPRVVAAAEAYLTGRVGPVQNKSFSVQAAEVELAKAERALQEARPGTPTYEERKKARDMAEARLRQARTEAAAMGGTGEARPEQPQKGPKSLPKLGPGQKLMVDANGNMAIYENGKFKEEVR